MSCTKGLLTDVDRKLHLSTQLTYQESFHTCVSNQCQQDDESVVNAIEEFIAGCKSFSANKLENGAALAMDSMKDLYITSQMAIIKRQAVAAASSGNSSNSTNGTTSGSTGTTGGAASTATGITATCTDLADVLSGVCLRSAASKSTAGLAVLAGVMGLAAML